jgi:glycosyltransferase involved in cell wall biosynthesis
MRVLHAYNQHRGGGGSDITTRATIEVSRRYGIDVEVFTRNSEDLPKNLGGRLQAARSAVYSPDAKRAFCRLVDSFRPDLLHAHEVFPLVTPWILPECTARGIPVVMSCPDYRMTCPVVTHLYKGEVCTKCVGGNEHWVLLRNCRGSIPEDLTVAVYNVMVRKLGLFRKHVHHFITPSEFTRQWFMTHAKIEASRISANSCVVDIPENASDPSSGGYIGFAGRFDPEKGISTLTEAARLCELPFRMARNSASLIRINVPSDISNLQVLVTNGRDCLDAFYRAARMLVVPSLSLETFCLVAAEAMSRGIPVVASRIGALAELIEDEVDGLLFEPGNAYGLVDKVSRLWANPNLCRSLGEAARRKAVALWSPRHHFERMMAVYEKVLGRPVTDYTEVSTAAVAGA